MTVASIAGAGGSFARLTRAVGTEAVLRADSAVDKAQAGDRYLLCSDGLGKVAPDVEVATMIDAGTIAAAADRLLVAALDRAAPRYLKFDPLTWKWRRCWLVDRTGNTITCRAVGIHATGLINESCA